MWWLQFSGIKWFWLRVVFTIIKYGFVWLLGAFTKQLHALIAKNSKNYFRNMLADTIAFGSYQIALYVAISLCLFDIPWSDVFAASTAYLLQFLAFGWVYSLALNKIKPKFPAFKNWILNIFKKLPGTRIKEKVLGLKISEDSRS